MWLLLLEQGKLILVRDNRAEHAQDSRQLLLLAYVRRLGGDCMTQPIDGRCIYNSNGFSQGLPQPFQAKAGLFTRFHRTAEGGETRVGPPALVGVCGRCGGLLDCCPGRADTSRHHRTAGPASSRRKRLDLTTYARLRLALATARAVPSQPECHFQCVDSSRWRASSGRFTSALMTSRCALTVSQSARRSSKSE
jgi:hypothetical protein